MNIYIYIYIYIYTHICICICRCIYTHTHMSIVREYASSTLRYHAQHTYIHVALTVYTILQGRAC